MKEKIRKHEMSKKRMLTKADFNRKRREALKNWLHWLCRSSEYGVEVYDYPQTLDIIDARECCPGDRLRGC